MSTIDNTTVTETKVPAAAASETPTRQHGGIIGKVENVFHSAYYSTFHPLFKIYAKQVFRRSCISDMINHFTQNPRKSTGSAQGQSGSSRNWARPTQKKSWALEVAALWEVLVQAPPGSEGHLALSDA
jgi:hypothetical protein